MCLSITELLQENYAKTSPDSRERIPYEFEEIKAMFQKAKDNGTRVLIENSELSLSYSVVVELEYVGDRWCMGKTRYHQLDKDEYIPYTISYADLYVKHSTGRPTKIIFEGENPFGKRPEQGS